MKSDSSFLPNVIVAETLKKLNVTDRVDKNDLKAKVQAGLDRLKDFQLASTFHNQQMENGMMMAHDGPIKTSTLRGVEDTPPYMHDGRLLTLDDTVEYFNLVLGVKLTEQEKKDLVAFLQTL